LELDEIIRLLGSHGADVNFQDDAGLTPLLVAVDVEGDAVWHTDRKPSVDLTKLLLSLGADPHIVNHNGKSAMDIAPDYEHEDAISLFKERTQTS
jgi:ankyrin repeat protein